MINAGSRHPGVGRNAGRLANGRYDRRQLDDVIASLQRVLQQNRLAQRDGDLLNDDLTVIALLTFVLDYGLLFWAEQRVTSGIAAVLLATIPVFMALSETVMLRKQRLTLRLAVALLVGLGGVGVLMSNSPPSEATQSTGLVHWPSHHSGHDLVCRCRLDGYVAAPSNQAHQFLILAGCVIGFTAYVWLLHHESQTKVGSYAYVNPVVAVLLGWCLLPVSFAVCP
jgi:drug/metabolite transporter (DMT)-like permease